MRAKTQAALEKAEAKIATLEARVAEIEANLSQGTGDLVALATEHTKAQGELTATLTEWERLSEELG